MLGVQFFIIVAFYCTISFCLNTLPNLSEFQASSSVSKPHLPKEVLRHVYKSVVNSNRRHDQSDATINNPGRLQGAHIALPNTVIQDIRNGKEAVSYFSFHLAKAFPKGTADPDEISQTVDIVQQNNLKFNNNKRSANNTKQSWLWVVSPGSRQGRGLMWKRCELAILSKRWRKQKANIGNNNNNKKQRWIYFRAKDASCVADLANKTSSKNGQLVYAAVSKLVPPISARQAKLLLIGRSTESAGRHRQQIRSNRHPSLMFVSFYSSAKNNEISYQPALPPADSNSPAATVSTEYAIDFLIGRHDQQQLMRLGRSISSSSRKFQDNFISSNVPNLCKRQSLFTNVEDVGLQDYIVYPRRFDIGRCSGACLFPLQRDVDPRTHTVIQLLHSMAQPDYVPAPTCVPVSFRPVSVLVRKNDNSIVVENFNDLIVQSCGCR